MPHTHTQHTLRARSSLRSLTTSRHPSISPTDIPPPALAPPALVPPRECPPPRLCPAAPPPPRAVSGRTPPSSPRSPAAEGMRGTCAAAGAGAMAMCFCNTSVAMVFVAASSPPVAAVTSPCPHFPTMAATSASPSARTSFFLSLTADAQIRSSDSMSDTEERVFEST